MKQYSFLQEGIGLTQAGIEIEDFNPMILKSLGRNVFKQYGRHNQRIEIVFGEGKNGGLYFHKACIYGTNEKKDQLLNVLSNLEDKLSSVADGDDKMPMHYKFTDIDTGKTEEFCKGIDETEYSKLNTGDL